MSDSTVGEHEIVVKNPWISDKTYTILEWVARVLLPALGTLYGAVGALWGVPNVGAVVGTIVAVDAFLGVFIGLAQKAYDASGAGFNGEITVTPTGSGGSALSNLVLEKDPSELQKLVLKVNAS